MSVVKDTRDRHDDSESPNGESERPSTDYYYDDATGYETYDAENEDDDEEIDER
jgi:hypothetical protein